MKKVLCLLVLYLVWGSTYYAMRVALGWLPPFLMAGPRFLIGGALLFAFLKARGAPWPTWVEWRSSGLVGILLLVFGNGFVAIGQRSVASGVAATVVATMPLWAALFSGLWGDKPTIREIGGLVLGFAGTVILEKGGSISLTSLDSIALLLAPIAWAFGSVLSRHLKIAKGSMNVAVQMMVGGLVMVSVAVARGEQPRGPVSSSAIFALAYLIVFGSLLALSAYGYLLQNTRPAIATSYAYVNPIVALVIGNLLGGESFTAGKLAACTLMICGVLVVTLKPYGRGAVRA